VYQNNRHAGTCPRFERKACNAGSERALLNRGAKKGERPSGVRPSQLNSYWIVKVKVVDALIVGVVESCPLTVMV
jgi:hypothetical protein